MFDRTQFVFVTAVSVSLFVLVSCAKREPPPPASATTSPFYTVEPNTMGVLVDPETGCQYLVTGSGGGITPRTTYGVSESYQRGCKIPGSTK